MPMTMRRTIITAMLITVQMIPMRLASFLVRPMHFALPSCSSLQPRVVYDAATSLSWKYRN